jgi:hypothetical protein
MNDHNEDEELKRLDKSMKTNLNKMMLVKTKMEQLKNTLE